MSAEKPAGRPPQGQQEAAAAVPGAEPTPGARRAPGILPGAPEPDGGPLHAAGTAAASEASSEAETRAFESAKVHAFIEAWVLHEHWFQGGQPDVETYSWPVPGLKAVVQDGLDAYLAYRDYISAFVLFVEGYGDALDDLKRLAGDLRRRFPDEFGRLMTEVAGIDETFLAQWGNLFDDPYMPALTHAALSKYARKYEVEWTLRVLACMRELLTKRLYDESLVRFRDRDGRLRKGVLVDFIAQGLRSYPHLQQAFRDGYCPPLRNAIGHNSYVIDETGVRSLDGEYAESAERFFTRMRALGAVQNMLVWLWRTSRQSKAELAPKGVVALHWGRDTFEGAPISWLGVLQLATFRLHDPDALWLDHATVTVAGDHMDTQLGEARSHGGPIPDQMRVVLDLMRDTGRILCEIIPVVPCLHPDALEHEVYELPSGRFCQLEESLESIVPVTVIDAA